MRTRPKCRPSPLASTLAFSLAATLVAAHAAHAADTADAPPEPASRSATLPEVVVSAERVESTLRKTPVSVAVVGTDALERQGIAQLSDLVGVVAGVSVPNGFSNMPQAVGIRGVGVSNAVMSQAVGIYIDDVPLVRGYATALWDLPDLVRIEVLRGPQGTLYGQNSTAGAVKLVSRDPSAAECRWVSLSAGNHGAREFHGYGNVRLDGTGTGTSASIAVSRRTNDGFGYNQTLDKGVNRLDATQFRLKLKQQLNDGLSALIAVDGLDDKSDANTTNFPLNHPDARPRVTFAGDPRLGDFHRRAGGAQIRLEQQLAGDAVFRSITSYRAYQDDPTRADWGGLAQSRSNLDQVVEQGALSQEFQLQGRGSVLGSAATWTTGVMLVRDDFDFVRFATAVPVATDVATFSEAQTHLRTTDLGVYAQGRLLLTADTGLTVGVRGYRTRQTGSNAFYRTTQDRVRTVTVYDADDLRFSKGGLLPRLAIDHQLDPRHMIYVSLAEGAKFGGFNRAAESLSSALVATSPEKVRTYEAGAKSRMLDGRLTTSVAAFHNDYRDYLAVLTNTTINGVLVVDPVMVNAGRARTWGVDLEFAAQLGKDLVWSGSVEWLGSKITAFANPTGAAGTDYVGHRLPYAPSLSAGTGLAYTWFAADGAAVRLDASAQYLRPQFADVANSAALALPSQVYLHLGGSYATSDGHWTFSLRIRNLADKTYPLLRTRIPPLGVDAAYYNAPRTVLLTARYDF
ncbi:MAG: TonB-dependent receptor [Rubrivivax sp.]|nr:MAG: TonB-dependent receptor [Rubrivivax sp.]